jgi:hypothetical protein
MQKQLKIPVTYFKQSNYALELSNELDNDANGLIFDRFIHDLGVELIIDIVYEKSNNEPNRWFLGRNKDLELFLDAHNEKYYELTINPLSQKGESQIEKLQIETDLLN